MTRKETLRWAMDTVSRIFHGHRDTTTIHGWVARDKNGGIRLWKYKPHKETNFEYGESWGLPCEMGSWIRLDAHLFPQVTWEDEEPTFVSITIKINQ